MTAAIPVATATAWFEYRRHLVHRLSGIAVVCCTTEVRTDLGTPVPAESASAWGKRCPDCWRAAS